LFNNNKKSFLSDQVTRPYKVRSGVIDRTVQLMVTPKVVEEARLHFDCPTIEGAELEDQGGDGTALTHWEKRIFQARMFMLHKTTTL